MVMAAAARTKTVLGMGYIRFLRATALHRGAFHFSANSMILTHHKFFPAHS